MTDVLLFHHAQGLTEGVRSFADELRAAGHTVVVPDFYDGRRFATLDEGMAYAEEVGFDQILERNVRSADDLPSDLVYAGFSLGEMSAQKLAQTRPGARGALLFYSCIPITGDWAFGPWPDGVPVQIHGMDPPRSSTRTTSISMAPSSSRSAMPTPRRSGACST
jgi:pimeloyl-ACP methyl ester carboxylesterase